MIVIYPFSTGDQDLALKNARWMNELGGCSGHEVLMGYDSRCQPGIVENIHQELTKAFDKVHRLEFPAQIDGWPQGANYFFRVVCSKIQTKPGCTEFFWMEPDAIPLKEGWLDAIAAEYVRSGRKFMGDRVEVENIPLHMSGVGVYPVPMHQYAGEAYRAHEIAWDMAGREQIIPQAYFTKLIEHAWKHPKFTSIDELQTQIRPEAVLFHSSKDGSLIDLLRGRKTAIRQPHKLETVGSTPTPATSLNKTYGSKVFERITCDIFIRTYPQDYPWLEYCLKSIQKFCSGFRKVWVVSPAENPHGMVVDLTWKQMQDESPDGYLAQQITKMYADVITDYQPDYILHVDSDVIFTKPCDPDFFLTMDDKKPIWYYTPYSEIQTPWQPITEKFLGESVPNEFMRRFPIMVPRWLYPRIREFCNKKHGMIISQYIKNQPLRAFSEFNAMGAYAFKYHRGMIQFVNTLEVEMPQPFAKQYHSWSGLSEEIKTEIENTLRGTEDTTSLVAAISHDPDAATSVPPHIKELPNGIWVLEEDTHISKWVEQQNRLDHDQNLLPFILPHIKPGDTVIDAGAFIGDHTIAYLRSVGGTGRVIAIEPNPVAMKCLRHNLEDHPELTTFQIALGDKYLSDIPLSGNNHNYGGSYLGDHMPVATVMMESLDNLVKTYQLKPDFIKLDIEGCEMRALDGMKETLAKFRPTLVMEVNVEALRRQGDYPGEIFNFLKNNGYDWQILQENCNRISPMYDILCRATKSPEDEMVKPSIHETAPPPPVTAPPAERVKYYLPSIEALKQFADESPRNRTLVMQRLAYAGLTKKPRTRRKK